MQRCPICGRFNVEYYSNIGTEKCLWKDCQWVNNDHENLEEKEYECNFKKFRDSIKYKTTILT